MGVLENKVAIVTGAGQGIGRGIALAFAKEGTKVVIAERNPKTAGAVAEEIRQLGKKATAIVVNVGDEGQVKNMVEQAVEAFGPIDILVNNAQGFRPWTHVKAPLQEIEEKWWDLQFQTGVKGTWYCCKAVFPYMKDRGGKVINISSSAGITGQEGMVEYAANKAAIRGFTKTAALEWGKYNINVNVICPAAATQAWTSYEKTSPEEARKALESFPLRRQGDPEKDIGRAAVFLAGPDSDFITGHTLMVDGGAHML